MQSESIISVDAGALQVLTAEEASYYRLLPFRLDSDGTLYCLGDECHDYRDTERDLFVVFGKKLNLTCVSSEELSRQLSAHYRGSPDSGNGVFVSGDASDIPSLIDEANRMRASDIHLEPSEHRCRVRFRIDGKLLDRHVIAKTSYTAVVNRIKIMACLDISEKRLPQDGRIIFEGNKDFKREKVRFDIRVSILPTIYGEKIVLRLLTMNDRHLSLKELGLDDRQYSDYLAAVSHPHGMILVSGPTGSGKSTTLHATLELLNRGDNNILTIEDPVEYTIEGVNQVQLKEEIGLDFPTALRTFLRQDPDIIMLGEIRDEDTARMAVRSSLTGHLLLSTLHTNSAWGCIARLSDMGVHPYLLSETLVACVAQRLIRTLCPHCKRLMTQEEIECQGPLIPAGSLPFIAEGCEHCCYTGYIGRKAIYEVIPIDGPFREAVRNNLGSVDDLMHARGMLSLKESAFRLFLKGETSLEEILPFIGREETDR